VLVLVLALLMRSTQRRTLHQQMYSQLEMLLLCAQTQSSQQPQLQRSSSSSARVRRLSHLHLQRAQCAQTQYLQQRISSPQQQEMAAVAQLLRPQ
jgi:hypothetical protein